MHLFLNIISGMTNSVDSDQTAPWNFSVRNFRVFTIVIHVQLINLVSNLFLISL